MFETLSKMACTDSLRLAGEFAKFDAARILAPINAARRGPAAEASVARLDTAYRDFVRRGECGQFLDVQLAELRAERAARRDSLRAAATIRNVAGVDWGASEGDVRAALGAPSHVTANADAQVVDLYYEKRDLVGNTADLSLTVHSRYGLVSGMYVIDLAIGDDCTRVFDSLKGSVQARYPSLRAVVDRRENQSTAVEQCDAIAIGRGTLATIWRDAVSNEIGILVSKNRSVALQSRGPMASHVADYVAFLSARKAF